jgi:ankyrin repeat protein
MAPIHVAAATSNLGRLREALDVGGQLVDSLNSDGATPLMYGAFAAAAEIVTELLQRGADPRAVDQASRAGVTPRRDAALV